MRVILYTRQRRVSVFSPRRNVSARRYRIKFCVTLDEREAETIRKSRKAFKDDSTSVARI